VVEIRMVRKRQEHFYEGGLYHLLIDPTLVRLRRLIRGQVKPGTTLIDFGCGTGELVFGSGGGRDFEADVVLRESKSPISRAQ